MMIKKRGLASRLAIFVAGLMMVWGGAFTSAHALTLTLDDGQNLPIVVEDADEDGFITYSASIGTWFANVVTGFSVPLIAPESAPEMDLNSVNVSGGAGTLTVTLEDKFTEPLDSGISGFTALWGGTTDGIVTLDVLINGLIYASFMSDGAAFHDSTSFAINPSNPYTIALVATITHDTGIELTSFDATIAPVPEPATIMLMGAGLLGLGGYARRRQLKKG